MSSVRFGILAEDTTDCDALAILVRNIAGPATIGVKTQSFGGCARLRQKAAPTMKLLAREGCAAVIVVHDLDRDPQNGELNDEAALRRQLEDIEVPRALSRLICIPVEELEAWFWSDPAVLALVSPGAKEHVSPHLLRQPKEKLIALSRGDNKKARYSTVMNKTLAAKLNLDLCASRCAAFRHLRDFVRQTIAAAGQS
jgi:hypothetical protein